MQYTYTIQNSDKGELKILRTQQTTENGVISANLENISLNQTIIANSNSSDEESNVAWTDFSNASYNWIDYTETDHSSPSLEIKEVDLKNIYYVHISHNENDTPDLTKIGEDFNYWIAISNGKISSTYLNSYLEENGDIYIWIAEVQNREEKIVVNAKKIERLEQLPLTKRIVGYFFSDFVGGFFCYEPHTVTNRKINVKIGEMTDISILKKIKNNDANCMSDLLNYAKNADAILEKTYSFGTNPDIPEANQLKNNSYYYVYFELEDENGKYYPVEDIELYQVSIAGDKVDLINHTDRNFVYNIDEIEDGIEDEIEDDTIAPGRLPQTGISIFIVSLIAVLVFISTLLAHGIKKYKDIK